MCSPNAHAQDPAEGDGPEDGGDVLRPPLGAPGDPLLEQLADDAEKGGREGDVDLGSDKVVGQEREAAEPATIFDIEIGQLGALPLATAADVMMLAPGVLTTNHGGDGHAHETFLRGFYAGEGQDIEYMLDGVPLNEVSNPHGHGYTDLFFLPPIWITGMTLSEGPFDPEQGDFAFAGSVNFRPGVSERGLFAGLGWGSFGTRRAELVWAPEGEAEGTFAGVQVYDTQGYGANRAAQRVA
ncbi:MAG: TonB-dependent receptor plug domain-containing protein, partial [Myxococcota bacterium]